MRWKSEQLLFGDDVPVRNAMGRLVAHDLSAVFFVERVEQLRRSVIRECEPTSVLPQQEALPDDVGAGCPECEAEAANAPTPRWVPSAAFPRTSRALLGALGILKTTRGFCPASCPSGNS
ncbi:MAG: hypothetical protein KDN22_29900 [Verrucomicrobiae bacterium]|nr:hypothetical protein [Verrucomicrobiae bacterium]